jgi:3-oxoacyl-[acyl-carrier protein] reductase
MGHDSHSDPSVAIVAGGATLPGRDVAFELANWAWPVVIVYLDHQSHAEAAVAEIIAAGGAAVAVRANLADDLDVQRLFTESIAAFGVVDVVVDMTTAYAAPLFEHAARYVRAGGLIVTTSGALEMTPGLASELHTRSIAVGQVPTTVVLGFLDRWRQRNHL